MSIFIENKISFPPQIVGNPILASWHAAADIVAIFSYNPNVNRSSVVLFDGQAKVIPQYKPRIYPNKPELLAWHPRRLLLIVAWRDCKLCACDFDNDSSEESGPGISPVISLCWNKTGSHLVATNKAGLVTVWETTHGGLKITKPDFTHPISQDPTALCFLEPKLNFAARSTVTVSPSKSITNTSSGKLEILIACRDASIFHMSESGKLSQVHQMSDPICSVRYYEVPGSRNRMVFVMMENNRIVKYEVDASLIFVEKISIALAGRTPPSAVIWLDCETVAIASVEDVVRVWDLRTSQKLELKISDFAGGEINDVIRSIGYNIFAGQLSAATNSGRLLLWDLRLEAKSAVTSHRLAFIPHCAARTETEVVGFTFCSNSSSFMTIDSKSAYLMREHTLASAYCFPIMAIQTAARTMILLDESHEKSISKSTTFVIQGISIYQTMIAVWGEKETIVLKVGMSKESQLELEEVTKFDRNYLQLYVHKSSLIAITEHSLNVLSIQGLLKTELKIQHTEGIVLVSCINKSVCAVATINRYIKLMDLEKNDGKQWLKSKMLGEIGAPLGRPILLSLNDDSTYLAFCLERTVQSHGHLFSVWDTEKNVIHNYDCYQTGSTEASGRIDNFQFSVTGLVVGSICWANDPRLLVVHFQPESNSLDLENKDFIVTFFLSGEKGISLNSVLLLENCGRNLILGCTVPFIYLYAPTIDSKGRQVVSKKYLPDFKDFKSDASNDLKILTDFSFFSCLGKIGEALNIVKNINNPAVWHHLTVLCVRMGRLEYAKICLGKLRRADILSSLRQFSVQHHDLQSQLGYLASILSLPEEAEMYFRKSGNSILLSNLQKSSGQWEALLEKLSNTTADRLFRRELLFTKAQEEVQMGEAENALKLFAEASCERFDVPRLLFRTKDPKQLQSFIDATTDVRLLSWYGRLLEAENSQVELTSVWTE